MPKHTMPTNITVHGVFDRDHLREQIIQPDRIFRVTYYFVDYWLPLLKPSAAWLVVALQQSYWQKEKGVITHARLGEQSGLKRHQVMNLLNDTERSIASPAPVFGTAFYLSWFLRGINRGGRAGQGKRANTYTVLLNAPLTPQHQAGLFALLTGIKQRYHDIEERLDAIQSIIDTPQAELLTRLQNTQAQLPSAPVSIEQMVMNVCDIRQSNHPLRETVQSAAARLTDHLLQPRQAYLGHQYFREKWISILGSNAGWMLTVIRRHGYAEANGSEIRNEFEYPRRVLAKKLGISERTLRRNLTEKEEDIRQFIPDLTTDKTMLSGHIRVNDDPLVASDKKMLAQWRRAQKTKTGQNSTTALAETGQNSTTASPGVGQNSTTAPAEVGQNSTTVPPEIGQDSTTASPEVGQNSTTASPGVGQNSTTVPPEIGQNSTTESFKALLKSTFQDSAPQQQQHQIVVADEDIPDSSPVKKFLAGIGIFEPALSRLLALPHVTPAYARRWRDWFVTQDRYGAGWVIRQMQSALSPPEKQTLQFPLPEYLRTEPSQLEKQWSQIVDSLRGTMTAAMHRDTVATAQALSLITPSSPDEPAILTVTAPTPIARAWLGERYSHRIQEVWEQLFDKTIILTVKEPVTDAQNTRH